MERDKLIKVIVAAVIGVAAIILLAMNFLGGGPPKPVETEETMVDVPARGAVPDG